MIPSPHELSDVESQRDRACVAEDRPATGLPMAADDIPTQPENLPRIEPDSPQPLDNKVSCLLHRCAAGDTSAVDRMFSQYRGLVKHLAAMRLNDKSLVEDTVSVILAEVWRASHRYDPERGSEVNFVGLIARRKIVDVNRRTRRASAHFGNAVTIDEALTESPTPRLNPEMLDNLAKAQRELAMLPNEMRRAVQLTCQGLTQVEIAEAMGVPLGTAKTWVRRGILRLREKLPDLVDSSSKPTNSA